MANDMNTRRRDAYPSVSVIIPAFNDQTGVNKCLRALARQTYPAGLVEVIVVDNGSVPALVVSDSAVFRVEAVRCPTPGSYAARNAGARKASGDALAFTDADCQPDPDWLARGIDALTHHSGNAVIGGEVILIDTDRPTAVALYQCATGFGQASNVREKHFAATANLFCTRAQFDATGPFEERLLSGGDREWCWRAATRGYAIVYAPTAVVRTLPRTSLRGAMRQARRVAAGRARLRSLELAHQGKAAVDKQRSAWQALTWVMRNPNLGHLDRLRVLTAATLIRGAELIEAGRLALGGRPERR